MRHLYLILISYLILTSFGVNSNTFRTYNPKLSILLNFRLSRFKKVSILFKNKTFLFKTLHFLGVITPIFKSVSRKQRNIEEV